MNGERRIEIRIKNNDENEIKMDDEEGEMMKVTKRMETWIDMEKEGKKAREA